MNLIRKTLMIISMAAAVIAASSCEKDETIRYGNFTMGNVVDGKFVSDQGNTFNVVEQLCKGKIDTMKRVIMICDVLNEVEGAENEYDIRLLQMANVLTKAPVDSTNAIEGDIAATDPIHINQLWISGGYINMEIWFETKVNSKTKHLINLIKNESKNDGYSFTLRHNAFGDTMTKDNCEDVFDIARGYVSFPITEIIKEDSAKITFQWKSHIMTGGAWSIETTDNDYTVEYTKGAFQHAPESKSITLGCIIK